MDQQPNYPQYPEQQPQYPTQPGYQGQSYPPSGYPEQSYQQPGYPGQPYPQSGYQQPYPGQPYPPQQPMMQPPKKRGGVAKGCGIAAAVFLVLVIVLVVFASKSGGGIVTPPATTGGSQASGSTVTTAPTTAATSAPANQHYKLGQTVKAGDWEMTVNSIKTSMGDDFDKPDPGKMFVEINVTVKNDSSQSQTFSSLLSCNLSNTDTGQKYEFALATDAGPGPDGDVEAGGKTGGTMAYSVPTTDKKFSLSFVPDLTSDNQVIWDLTV